MSVCVHTSLCLCGCLWRLKQDVDSIEAGVTDVSEMSIVGVGSKFQSSDRAVTALNR